MPGQERSQRTSLANLIFDYPAYLEAKFAIDSASLNVPLHTRFAAQLQRKVNPRVLDLGTGTGAMLQRILDLDVQGQVVLIGLDQEERNLAVGLERIEQALNSKGFKVREKRAAAEVKRLFAEKQGTELRVELLRGDLLDGKMPDRLGAFDCVTAHAFMDLMPLKPAVAIIRSLLKTQGLFYSTLNYDGQSALLPEYEDAGYERRLLRIYDRSMERRRVGGRKTGGAWSGRRLYHGLYKGGFTILGVGSSDWNVYPVGGGYSDEQKLFLTAIVSMIAREAWTVQCGTAGQETNRGRGGVEFRRLNDWYASRIEALRSSRLSLLVHQLDLLAELSFPDR